MHQKNYSIFAYISNYDKDYIKSLDKNVNIIFRNYSKTTNVSKLSKFKNFCKANNHKVYLANNMRLALTLKFDGVYIPSFNKKINFTLNKRTKNFKIIGSAHNLAEIRIKEKQGVDMVFISPLFKVNKSSNFLDILKFNQLALSTNKEVIALGGINKFNIKKLNILSVNGFSGISYFKKKRPLKKRPFKCFKSKIN